MQTMTKGAGSMLHQSNEPDPKILSFLARSERPALIAAALVSGIVLAIWLILSIRDSVPVG